jgi:hypothetical protein
MLEGFIYPIVCGAGGRREEFAYVRYREVVTTQGSYPLNSDSRLANFLVQNF